MKQMRRGGGVGNGHRGGYPGPQQRHQQHTALPGINTQNGTSVGSALPGMPPLSGMPLPDQEAMSTMMALSTVLGMPPPIPPAQPSGGNAHVQGTRDAGKTRINARCRDYDTKGFCLKGIVCPFNHGDNQVVVPGQPEGASTCIGNAKG